MRLTPTDDSDGSLKVHFRTDGTRRPGPCGREDCELVAGGDPDTCAICYEALATAERLQQAAGEAGGVTDVVYMYICQLPPRLTKESTTLKATIRRSRKKSGVIEVTYRSEGPPEGAAWRHHPHPKADLVRNLSAVYDL